ncbi:uncharacterized protein MYCFIDRAFT_179090 [Pseudocercospora fijiensis CIRAD86]|uniref:Uncharacterized protein n=1 Tax=Pseudocercospora fijiensis (strain CIRAD86) TaxID=383855 RepID=M2ZZH7_PSEFD|nr:uncharacterized protein MYCFIDRAFT_179090 [Pseudocercospora fijiensis CIRAD86]EME77571.1 hypothetical protein MYCFIDRAFT_179090 [Pseudocercospora fijiensis CIRAD86]
MKTNLSCMTLLANIPIRKDEIFRPRTSDLAISKGNPRTTPNDHMPAAAKYVEREKFTSSPTCRAFVSCKIADLSRILQPPRHGISGTHSSPTSNPQPMEPPSIATALKQFHPLRSQRSTIQYTPNFCSPIIQAFNTTFPYSTLIRNPPPIQHLASLRSISNFFFIHPQPNPIHLHLDLDLGLIFPHHMDRLQHNSQSFDFFCRGAKLKDKKKIVLV